MLGVNGQGADLAEVLPEHVQRTTADDLAVHLGDPELLYRFVQSHGVLREQQSLAGVGVDKPFDRRDIRRSSTSDEHVTGLNIRHGRTIPKRGATLVRRY